MLTKIETPPPLVMFFKWSINTHKFYIYIVDDKLIPVLSTNFNISSSTISHTVILDKTLGKDTQFNFDFSKQISGVTIMLTEPGGSKVYSTSSKHATLKPAISIINISPETPSKVRNNMYA